MDSVPSILNNLIGQTCYEARTGLSKCIVLGFGEKIYDNKKDPTKFSWEWDIQSDYSSWRLIYKNEILCGHYDDYENVDKLLENLVFVKLSEINQLSLFDVEFVFENGYSVILCGISREEDIVGILAPENQFIGFDPIRKWYVERSDIPIGSGLSGEEKLFDLHAEKCHERWKKIVPKSVCKTNIEPKGDRIVECNNCAYNRLLLAKSYFWDYCICSNEHSTFDGALVGFYSSCEYYSEYISCSQNDTSNIVKEDNYVEDVCIPITLYNLIGQQCCEAREGYYCAGGEYDYHLVLGFGEKIHNEDNQIHPFYGEWELRTESCTWRLVHQDKILCADYDDSEKLDDLLSILHSKKLVDIKLLSPPDMQFLFEDDYRLDFICQSGDTDLFEIYAPSKQVIGLFPDGIWCIESTDIPLGGLDEEENVIDKHSELCFKRWKKRIPTSIENENCRDCAYYITLRGAFRTWDFGICSCGKSKFDGKLVGKCMGCGLHSKVLQI